MGRPKKTSKERKRLAQFRKQRKTGKQRDLRESHYADREPVRAILTGHGLKPITPELAADLVAAGKWTNKQAEEALAVAAEGFFYSRDRNSLLSLPEFSWDDDGDDDWDDDEGEFPSRQIRT